MINLNKTKYWSIVHWLVNTAPYAK